MAKIYVASSWRNAYQPDVVRRLREAGHEVYDFRNPPHGRGGFHWADIDPAWKGWSVEEYIRGLDHPHAREGFRSDYEAMLWADVCVLVLPCGRSAHAEAGWMQGAGKPTYIYIPEKQEPELMYRLFTAVSGDLDDIIRALEQPRNEHK